MAQGDVVQSKAIHAQDAATSTTLVLDSTPTNGNTLVLVWTMREANDETFTPNNGTWTSIIKVHSDGGSNGWPHEMFYQEDISGRSATTTVSHPATLGGSRELAIVELEGGLDFDTFISANNTSSCTGSITPAATAVAALVSSVYNRNDSGPGLLSPETGMTELQEAKRVGVNHRKVTSPSGSYTIGSTSASGNSSMIGAAFKAGSGGGGGGGTARSRAIFVG